MSVRYAGGTVTCNLNHVTRNLQPAALSPRNLALNALVFLSEDVPKAGSVSVTSRLPLIRHCFATLRRVCEGLRTSSVRVAFRLSTEAATSEKRSEQV